MARHPAQPVVGPSTEVDQEPDDPNESPSRPDWLMRGQTIGRYLVLECLGVGGMGVIYSAWDPKLDRKLAIKVVRGRNGNLGSPRGRARLLREGQALARLRHPNVIAVHDVGTHEGRVFVAMEFVEGQTLFRWLLRSPKPPGAEIIDVFLKVGRGLAAAHRASLVHRDVKPENVMIGDDGRVMVLDFGIAREGYGNEAELRGDPSDEFEAGFEAGSEELLDAADPDELGSFPASAEIVSPAAGVGFDEAITGQRDPAPRTGAPVELLGDRTPLPDLTRKGAIVGTPAYMSPEQHRGRPVDPRGDQFSFCVAMWEALNGEKPYGDGKSKKLLARMRLAQVKPFRNRDVPRRIATALHRGLSWSPAERYPSMEALLEALNPRGRSAEQRLWQGLGIGALAGVAVGVLATLSSINLEARPDLSPGPQAPSYDDPSAELDRDPAGTLAPESSAARERVAELNGQLDELDRPVALTHGGDPLVRSRQLLAAARVTGHAQVLTRASLIHASLLEHSGELAEAEATVRAAAEAAALANDPRAQAEAMLGAARLINADGRADEARRWLDLAAAMASTAPEDHALQISLHRTLAALHHRGGELERARQDMSVAVDLLRLHGDPGVQMPVILRELAQVSAELGDELEAVALLRRALALNERAYGPAHDRVRATRSELARELERLGELDAALDEYERVLGSAERRHGSSPETALARAHIGALLARTGRCDEAWRPLGRAVDEARAQLPASPAGHDAIPLDASLGLSAELLVLATTLEAQALACELGHEHAGARAREAVEIREQLQGPSHPELAIALTIEALTLLDARAPEAALAQIERAAAMLDGAQVSTQASSFVVGAQGVVLASLGQEEQARELLIRARPGLGRGSELEPRVVRALADLD